MFSFSRPLPQFISLFFRVNKRHCHHHQYDSYTCQRKVRCCRFKQMINLTKKYVALRPWTWLWRPWNETILFVDVNNINQNFCFVFVTSFSTAAATFSTAAPPTLFFIMAIQYLLIIYNFFDSIHVFRFFITIPFYAALRQSLKPRCFSPTIFP